MIKNSLDIAKKVLDRGLERKADREARVHGTSAEMSLVEHVIELRGHAFRAALYFAGLTVVAMVFMDELLAFLREPFVTYQKAAGRSPELVTTAVFEVIVINFKVCMLVAFIASVPLIIWEIWKFVAPAMYPKEKRIAQPIVLASVVMFYLGVAFGFFVIVPAFLSNTLEWASQYATVMLTVGNYYNSLATMVFIFGIIFEVPVIMSLLGLAGLVTSDMIAKNRRVVIMLSAVIGAILSPPDVFSLIVTAVPMYAMVEISVIALRMIERNRAGQQ
jgi:sec-independent protein translocase protein TatC